METYSKLVFTDAKKRKEWEEMDPAQKKRVLKILEQNADRIETIVSIKFMCQIIGDLEKRIIELERKNGLV